MHWIRFCFTALLAVFAQLLVPSAAHAKWLKAETRHFIIYSEGSEKELRAAAIRLERFDALLKLKLGFEDKPHQPKLPIYFLERRSDVAALAKGWLPNAAGFFSTRAEGSYAVANREKAANQFDLGSDGTLMHEYGHFFMFRNASFPYPTWYVEGFAEFVSTTTIDDAGNWTMGKPANHRAYSLLKMERLPIEKLLFGRYQGLTKNETSVFYGRSWLLTHMLLTRPEHNKKLGIYFGGIAAGKDQRQAAIEALGDLAELDKTLDRYQREKLTFISSRSPLNTDTTLTVVPLDAMTDGLIPLRLKRLSASDIADLPARFEQLAARFPAEAEPLYELAMTYRGLAAKASPEERSALDAKAEAAVDRALALNPKHVRANVIKADYVMRRLRLAGETSPEKWSAARAYLLTANQAASDDPMVLVAWYDSFGRQRRVPSQTARDGLARAFELVPEQPDIRARYAYDLAAQNRFDEAIKLAETLAFNPHSGAQGERLLERIKAMRDRKAPKPEE